MTEDERYEQICKPWMARMEAEAKEAAKQAKETTTEILHILKGRNGDPGVVDNVRTIMESRAGWGKIGWVVVVATVTQIVILFFAFLNPA